MKLIVTTKKIIQIRFEHHTDYSINDYYHKPGIAARRWAKWKTEDWYHTLMKNKNRHLTDMAYVALKDEREERYYRKSLPIFKAMLK